MPLEAFGDTDSLSRNFEVGWNEAVCLCTVRNPPSRSNTSRLSAKELSHDCDASILQATAVGRRMHQDLQSWGIMAKARHRTSTLKPERTDYIDHQRRE